MVKQAERHHKPSPLLPIFGIIIAVGLAVVALVLTTALIDGGSIQPLRQFQPANSPNRTIAILGIGFAMWLPMFALVMLFVTLLAGKDPEDAKQIQLPPRVKKKKFRR